jgi:hypothetical protein
MTKIIGIPHPKGFNARVRVWINLHHDGNVLAASRATKVPRNTLWQIYRGLTRTPSAHVLVKLSSAMGVSIDWLLTGEKHGNE